MIDVFLETKFEENNERHVNRVKKMSLIEESQIINKN
jgi:ribose 5-phosphate isomerase RpiB